MQGVFDSKHIGISLQSHHQTGKWPWQGLFCLKDKITNYYTITVMWLMLLHTTANRRYWMTWVFTNSISTELLYVVKDSQILNIYEQSNEPVITRPNVRCLQSKSAIILACIKDKFSSNRFTFHKGWDHRRTSPLFNIPQWSGLWVSLWHNLARKPGLSSEGPRQ